MICEPPTIAAVDREAGMNQEEIAAAFGVSTRTVRRWGPDCPREWVGTGTKKPEWRYFFYDVKAWLASRKPQQPATEVKREWVR